MDIPLKIKELLTEKKMSITEFSDKLDISRNTVYNFLNKKYPIDVELLLKISDLLAVPVSVFFDINQVENNPELEAIRKENEMLLLTNQLNETKLKASQALIRLIRSRLKDSNYQYAIYCKNSSKIKLGKVERAVVSEIEMLYKDTYNQILAAISFIERITPGNIKTDSLINQENDFMDAFGDDLPGEDFNKKIDRTLMKLIRFMDEDQNVNENSENK